MPRETLLQESVRETKETLQRWVAHNRALTVLLTAIIVAVVGVAIGISRGDDDPSTDLRADQKTLTPGEFSGGGNNPQLDDQYPTASTYAVGGVPGATGTTVDGMKGIDRVIHPPTRSVVVTVPNGTPVTTKDGTTVTTIVQDDGSPTTVAPGNGGGHTNTTVNTGGSGFDTAAFDSGRIAYVSGGATWTVRPDGSGPLKVSSNAYNPAWSRGRTLLAMNDRDASGGSLFYVTYTGGRAALTNGPSGQSSGDSTPAWSPSGDQVVFGRVDFGNGTSEYSSLWIVNRDGSSAHKIVSSFCYNREPTWSPDGEHIVFWSSRDHCSDGQYELYVVNVDGTGLRKLGTATNSGSPTFSPDGGQIAFASDRTGNFEIYVMNVDGSGQTRLTTASGDDTDPSFSPDGSRIAFRSARNGGGIFTMKTDGTDVKFVVSGTQPTWS